MGYGQRVLAAGSLVVLVGCGVSVSTREAEPQMLRRAGSQAATQFGAQFETQAGSQAGAAMLRVGDASAEDAGPVMPPQTSEAALAAMAARADVIFTGQVSAVRRHDGAGGAGTGVVEIDFAVEDAVRGVAGASYRVREWAGLWRTGAAPFRAGQRYLMLLHAPGQAGLSSPVGGDGAIPIAAAGKAARPDEADEGEAAGDSRVVDLRWVAAGVLRPMSYRVEAPRRGTSAELVRAGEAAAEAATAAAMSAATVPPNVVTAGAAASDAATKSAAYASVVGMLRAWERDGHAGR